MVDSILLEIRESKPLFQEESTLTQAAPSMEIILRRTADPFLAVSVKRLIEIMDTNKKVKLVIEISDAEASSVSLDADFQIVTDPYDKVEI